MSARQRSNGGAFSIGGSDKTLVSLGAALSYAQNLMSLEDEERQVGIYENGQQVARVERRTDGVVITTVFP